MSLVSGPMTIDFCDQHGAKDVCGIGLGSGFPLLFWLHIARATTIARKVTSGFELIAFMPKSRGMSSSCSEKEYPSAGI